MRLRRRKAPAPGPVLAYCEMSTASVYSPFHVRMVGPEGLMTGGGVPVPTLCGRDLRYGWDVREVTAADLVTARTNADPSWPGHTCPVCRDRGLSYLSDLSNRKETR